MLIIKLKIGDKNVLVGGLCFFCGELGIFYVRMLIDNMVDMLEDVL